MTQRLDEVFGELGIPEYLGPLRDQGFDTWEVILDITESDLDALGVKLGHRRKLQRCIASFRGVGPRIARLNAHRPDVAKGDHRDLLTGAATKRKYRRHPKPDETAPERPPSSYVLFSNKVREDLKGRNLTFAEITKRVGENWHNLSQAEKEPFEEQSRTAKDKYNQELAVYKQAPEYKKYMVYLQEFKAKHSSHSQDKVSKRPKLSESSNVGMSSLSNGTAPRPRSATRSESTTLGSHSEPPPSREQRMMSPQSPHANPIGRSLDIFPDLSVGPREARATQTSRWVEEQRTKSDHRQHFPSLSDWLDGTVLTNGAVPTPEANVYGGSPQSHLNGSPGPTTASDSGPPSFMTNGRDDAKNPSTHPPLELTPNDVSSRGMTHGTAKGYFSGPLPIQGHPPTLLSIP